MAQETKQFLDEVGLARYNSHINDVTTGINLIRGSRDFTRDIDDEKDYILTSGLKGFHTVGDESALTYTTDDVGFTIATITRNSSMYDESMLTSSRFSLKDEKFITYSGEIRIDSIGRLSKFAVVAEYMAFNIKSGNVGEFVRQKTISCNDLKINYQKVGEWQPFKFTIDLSDIEATWMYVRARIDVEASVSYRNLVAQYGEINNPGWSQNPFDVEGVLPPENGGTGWEHGLNSGINIVPGTSNEWSEWITPATNTYNITTYLPNLTVNYPSERNFGDLYTSYIEVEFENVTAVGGKEWCFFPLGRTDSNYDSQASPWNEDSFDNGFKMTEVPESGKCYKIKRNKQITSTKYLTYSTFSVGFRCDYWASGSFRYRCLKIERGHVDYPQWSPAPEDVTKINDYTTGINLLKGTRNFVIGSHKFGSSIFNTDGFYIPSNFFTQSKDKDGFVVLTNNVANSVDFISAIYDGQLSKGDKFTYSFEVNYANPETFPGNTMAVIYVIDSGGNVKHTENIGFTNLGINKAALEGNKWYRFTYFYTVPIEIEDSYALRITLVSQSAPAINQISFKKPIFIRDHINNPIWSASPFDIDHINDETTGINLLRETRDLKKGTTIQSSLFYKDGWYLQHSPTITTDAEGFGVANLQFGSQQSLFSSAIKGIEKGDEVTFSFEIMVDKTEELRGDFRIGMLTIRDSNWSDSGQMQKMVTFANCGLSVENIKPGKWYLVRFVTEITREVSETDLCIASLAPNSEEGLTTKAYYKKPALYKGIVNNPIWSASPFDVASFQIEQGSPLMLGDIPIENTLKSGDDLDDFIKPGTYSVITSSTVPSIANVPSDVTRAFRLIVENALNSNGEKGYIRQRLTIFDQEAAEYIRWRNILSGGGAWYPWRKTYANTTVRPIEGGGTGASNRVDATAILFHSGNNRVFQTQEELDSFKPFSNPYGGYSNSVTIGLLRSVSGVNFDVPFYGFVYAMCGGGQFKQFILSDNSDKIAFRSFLPATNKWTSWSIIQTTKGATRPYNPGLYSGYNIADLFKNEIGSTHIATWLKSRVSEGNFEGLNIGDYVDITLTRGTKRYIIGAIDPYYKLGSPSMGHHILMIPDSTFGLSQALDGDFYATYGGILWNKENTNNGTESEESPYLSSNLHKWELEVLLKQFPQEWQNAMIDRIAMVETRYNTSSQLTNSTGSKWANLGKIWSLSEIELYGESIHSDSYQTMDCQFPYFSLTKNAVASNNFFTRDVCSNSSTQICYITSTGIKGRVNAASSVNPRPCFLLG